MHRWEIMPTGLLIRFNSFLKYILSHFLIVSDHNSYHINLNQLYIAVYFPIINSRFEHIFFRCHIFKCKQNGNHSIAGYQNFKCLLNGSTLLWGFRVNVCTCICIKGCIPWIPVLLEHWRWTFIIISPCQEINKR